MVGPEAHGLTRRLPTLSRGETGRPPTDVTTIRPNDRLAALAGVVVTMTGVISVVGGWGAILVLAVLAGIGTVGVVLAPQLAPSARLPGSHGSLLVLLGAVAVLAWIPPLIGWLDWIVTHLPAFSTIQFLVGFVSALVLGWTGWTAFRREGGMLRLGPPVDAPADTGIAHVAHPPATVAEAEPSGGAEANPEP